MSKEKPQALQGMRDFLPQQMIARQYVLQTARKVYESFGFEPLDTPCVEYAEVLMGKYGPEADKLIYNFEDRGGRRVGLRYDLTVPLARVIASHGDLPRPFKRYQVGPVWRAERPQKGRYREFTQCDIDIVGANPPAADAEVVAAFFGVYEALGLSDVVIRLNHRGILGAAARVAGLPDEQRVLAFRSIDKLDKISPEAVLQEMVAAGIEPSAGEKLLQMSQLQIGDQDLSSVRSSLEGDEGGLAAVEEMAAILSLLRAMGVPEKNFTLDLSLARGLDYYTGPILEAVLPELRSSVGGGGRYDNLIGMFGIGSVPTVGASVGLDRIIDVLAERDALPKEKTVVQVLMTVFNSESRPQSLALAADLRKAGLAVETYLLDRPLGKQFAYADGKGIPFAIVVGPDERAAGTATLRNLRLREQVTVLQSELVARIVG